MKERITKFGVWMRNGICFAFTWLMLLSILGNYILGQETMSVDGISKLFVFVTGGVFLFTIFLSKPYFRSCLFHTIFAANSFVRISCKLKRLP